MSAAAAPKASPKKRGTGKAKSVSTHPPYASMVKDAITKLKEPKGSSKISIQKFILANYKFTDPSKVTVQLRSALRKLSDAGVIRHAKGGTGASGSFKLAEKAKSPKKPKAKKATKPKVAGAKKSPKKKTAAKKATSSAAAPPAAAPKKSPKKAKKPAASKSPAKKASKAKKSPKKAGKK